MSVYNCCVTEVLKKIPIQVGYYKHKTLQLKNFSVTTSAQWNSYSLQLQSSNCRLGTQALHCNYAAKNQVCIITQTGFTATATERDFFGSYCILRQVHSIYYYPRAQASRVM